MLIHNKYMYNKVIYKDNIPYQCYIKIKKCINEFPIFFVHLINSSLNYAEQTLDPLTTICLVVLH